MHSQVVVFDNTPSAVTGDVQFRRWSLDRFTDVAQSFVTPAEPLPQTSYTLSMATPKLPDASVFFSTLQLLTDGENGLQAPVTVFNFDHSAAATTVLNGVSYQTYSGSFSLAPNTRYWIYAYSHELVTWSLSDNPVSTGVAAPGPWALRYVSHGVGGWVEHTESQLMMQLVAVPEPVHASLLAGSLLGLAAIVRAYRLRENR